MILQRKTGTVLNFAPITQKVLIDVDGCEQWYMYRADLFPVIEKSFLSAEPLIFATDFFVNRRYGKTNLVVFIKEANIYCFPIFNLENIMLAATNIIRNDMQKYG